LIILLTFAPKNYRKMIRNTDKKHKGTATAAVGTFGARKAGALLLVRRSLETAPSALFLA
jgi:hypothetical protein